MLRGLAVMGMILANASAAMSYDNKAQVYATLSHEHWNGLHLADTVFPAFLMMMGVAIPTSLDRDKRGVGPGAVGLRITRRCVRLFVIGFLLSNLHWLAHMATADWRFWGVLQRIGIVYGICALIFLKSGIRAWVATATVLLVAYWPLILLPQPDGQSTDLRVRGLNLAGWADRATLGAGNHIYVAGPQGYDPEGLLGTLPAIAQGVTDAMPSVGSSDKSFILNGERIEARDGICRSSDGTLAGCDLDMTTALRNIVGMTGIDIADASHMASGAPARFLGFDDVTGSVVVGRFADLAWLGREGVPKGVWRHGRRVGSD
ncbi:Amidohydrolase family protein [Sphingomonas gellani]|uniref:Amidohydrolase family protein n=1 Tax=Sphingomonas gellani TaxID=1166340 RepID=A0A1H8DCT8_9SPHN|nr:Amidohydrolase family protein [Sphingomonas gellani]